MQQLPSGELIRQVRRQYNLTQTELGGEHFSNQWLQAALRPVKAVVESGERDPGYLARSYRRGFNLLEQRLAAFPGDCEETTKTLVKLLKTGIEQLPYVLLPANA